MGKRVELVSGANINALEEAFEEEFRHLSEIRAEWEKCSKFASEIEAAHKVYANGAGEVIVDKDYLNEREELLKKLTGELDFVESQLDEIEYFLVQRPEKYVGNQVFSE
jgi:hypothetical protein